MFSWVFGSSSDEENTVPYNSILLKICEKINIDPMKFQEQYTVEQMLYIYEWIIYNINDKTEEWREMNDKIRFNKENKDEDLLELIS